MKTHVITLSVLASLTLSAQQAAAPQNPRQQPGAMVHIFAPEQHDLYDGHFVISANRIYMVGGLNDPEGWDHLDNDARTLRPVGGTAEIDVDEIRNTGKFEVRLKIPEGDLVLAVDKWNEFNPCQKAASSPTSTNTAPTQGVGTTTGRRPSASSPDGASGMPR